MKRILAVLLLALLCLLPLKGSVAEVRDNRLNIDAGRVANEEGDSMGNQSSMVSGLFKKSDTEKLAEGQTGKTALSSQQKQLFQKGTAVATDQKTSNTVLFQGSVTHILSATAGESDNALSWSNTLIYSGVILLTVSVAGIFTYRLSKAKEEVIDGID